MRLKAEKGRVRGRQMQHWGGLKQEVAAVRRAGLESVETLGVRVELRG